MNNGVFVSGSDLDRRIEVWDEKGDSIETHISGVTAMTRLRDGSIVIANNNQIEIRQL